MKKLIALFTYGLMVGQAFAQSDLSSSSADIISKISTEICQHCNQYFITTWQISSNQTLAINLDPGYSYDFQYYWLDPSGQKVASGTYMARGGEFASSFASAGTYTLMITGEFPHFTGYKQHKLKDVVQWGTIQWGSMKESFYNWPGKSFSASDSPDLSHVSDMSFMFQYADAFRGNLSTWDVSQVTNMSGMFDLADAFNGDLSSWDVSNVQNMSFMFSNSHQFNGNVSGWDVSNVTNMAHMFASAFRFNRDLRNWNVSNVTNMSGMFELAAAFDGDLSKWDVSKVMDLSGTFKGARSFDANLGMWNISQVATMENMFDGSGLSQRNYDQMLIGWAIQNKAEGVILGVANISYCQGMEARNHMIDQSGWIITDAGQSCDSDLAESSLKGTSSQTLTDAKDYQF